MSLSLRDLPADTCPLCRKPALSWQDAICSCASCGSLFEVNRETRLCRYLLVAPRYDALASELISTWRSRRAVFDLASQFANAESIVREAPPPANTAQTHKPYKLMLLASIGLVTLFAILCACLVMTALAQGISQTRQMIAAANPLGDSTRVLSGTLTYAPAVSRAGDAITSVQLTADALNLTKPPAVNVTVANVITPINPLKSPLSTPTVAVTSLAVSTRTATAMPSATSRPPIINQTSAPVLPATFTPLPTVLIGAATSTPIEPTSIVMTETATATSTAVPVILSTATLTPSPTLTPDGLPTIVISSSVVISTVMYAGTASLNMSDQYVEIQNRGSGPVSIGNWRVHAVSSNLDFFFTTGLVLLPSQTCRVYGGSPPVSTSGCGAFSFYKATPVWSTIADSAELFDESGVLVGVYTYTSQR